MSGDFKVDLDPAALTEVRDYSATFTKVIESIPAEHLSKGGAAIASSLQKQLLTAVDWVASNHQPTTAEVTSLVGGVVEAIAIVIGAPEAVPVIAGIVSVINLITGAEAHATCEAGPPVRGTGPGGMILPVDIVGRYNEAIKFVIDSTASIEGWNQYAATFQPGKELTGPSTTQDERDRAQSLRHLCETAPYGSDGGQMAYVMLLDVMNEWRRRDTMNSWFVRFAVIADQMQLAPGDADDKILYQETCEAGGLFTQVHDAIWSPIMVWERTVRPRYQIRGAQISKPEVKLNWNLPPGGTTMPHDGWYWYFQEPDVYSAAAGPFPQRNEAIEQQLLVLKQKFKNIFVVWSEMNDADARVVIG